MSIGERFREARERAHLSQGQVAEYAETGQGYLSDIELNKRWPSTWGLIGRLAKLYGTSTDYLLGLTDDPRQILSATALADALAAGPAPAPEIEDLLRLAARLDEERLYALLTVAEALAALGDPSPGEIIRRTRRTEGKGEGKGG